MSQLFPLELVKNIDQVTKDIVFGYIRQCEINLLPNNNTFFNISSLIKFICIIYYWRQEYFTSHGSCSKLNDEKDIVTNTEYKTNTVYGNININNKISCIYLWTFKIINWWIPTGQIFIGIDSSNKKFIEKNFTSHYNHKNPVYYAFDSDGYKISTDDQWADNEYGKQCKSGDIVKMEVNILNKTITFYINDKCYGIAYKNIDFENKTYNMAVSMHGSTDSVQLIAFQHIKQ